MDLWSNMSGTMQKFCMFFFCFVLFWVPSRFTTNMFLKIEEELVQTSVHRNGINIAVKTRVGGITLALGLIGTTEFSSHVDSVTHSGNKLPSAAL